MASKKNSFENKLQTLETIVANLESGQLSLEDSLMEFEKGVSLTRECQQLLDQVEQKVSILTAKGELQDFNANNQE